MGFLGSLGQGLSNVANVAVKASPYALRAVEQQHAQEEADKQRALAQAFQQSQETRAAALNSAQIDHLRAQTGALDEGQWGPAFAATDNDGTPVMVQQHKQTGELRRAVIRNGATAPVSPTTPSTGSEDRGMASPSLDLNGMPSAPKPPQTSTPTPQTPAVAKGATPPPAPTQSGGTSAAPTTLRPYVKPPVTPVPYRLTPVGMTADSTAAAKKAQAEAPYKKDPNAAPTPTFTPFQGTDAIGKPVVRPFNTKTGQFGPVADIAPKTTTAAGSAPMAAKVGQAGEMLKKAGDLLPMMEGLGVSLGQSASADIAQNGVGIGHARIPGTKGVGNALLNNNATYAQYQAALSPFVLAAAHALSGARINQDQATQIRQSVEIAPRDLTNPQVMKQKMKNMIDLVNSISGSLPADAIGAQEAQIDDATIAKLEGYGYRRAGAKQSPGGGRGGGGAPSHDPGGNVDLTKAPSKKAPAATGKDYGIFGKPSGGDDE